MATKNYEREQKVMIITSISDLLLKLRGKKVSVKKFDALYDATIMDCINEYNALVSIRLALKMQQERQQKITI